MTVSSPAHLRVDATRLLSMAPACRNIEEIPMEDLMWLGFIVALLAATLVYVRLCDNA
jgi:hypothetical protein